MNSESEPNQNSFVLVDGGTVEFRPTPEWQWSSWDGCMKVRIRQSTLRIDRFFAATEKDACAWAADLSKKEYVTPAFSVPGAVSALEVVVDSITLSKMLDVDGTRAMLSTTTGRFVMVVSQPAQAPTDPPTYDTILRKMGTWNVTNAGQFLFRAS